MKRGKLFIVVAVFVVVVFGLECLREGSHFFQSNLTESNLQSLSQWIEFSWEDHGHYPDSLSDLLLNTNDDAQGRQAIKDLIERTEHNVWHDRYDYNHSTNGFTLTVTGPDGFPMGWLGKQRKIERHYDYKAGDLFKGNTIKDITIVTNK